MKKITQGKGTLVIDNTHSDYQTIKCIEVCSARK